MFHQPKVQQNSNRTCLHYVPIASPFKSNVAPIPNLWFDPLLPIAELLPFWLLQQVILIGLIQSKNS